MDYLITFDDGSSAYLEHYGTKGMKWGVWNDETRAKYGASGTFSGGGGAIQDDEEGSQEESSVSKITVHESISPTEALGRIGSAAKGAALSKIDDAKSVISDGKKAVDNYLKYRGNKAKETMTIRTPGTDGYDREVYQATLKNGRRRSWVQESKGSSSMRTRKTRTPSDTLSKKPSERISQGDRNWFKVATR